MTINTSKLESRWINNKLWKSYIVKDCESGLLKYKLKVGKIVNDY